MGGGKPENRMYIWEQIQFEWISSKLEMGNPGLPDPRVAPRVSPSLLTFPPTLPLPLLLFPRSLVRIVSSRSFPPLPAHAHSPCFHPSARSDPLRRSKRYFRRQIPPQQRETFRTPGCFPLTFLSPPATGIYTAFLCLPSPPLPRGRANRIRPTSRYDTFLALPFAPPRLVFGVERGQSLGGSRWERLARRYCS